MNWPQIFLGCFVVGFVLTLKTSVSGRSFEVRPSGPHFQSGRSVITAWFACSADCRVYGPLP